ncbi:MAG TPA: hypothetical protein DDY98_09315 [Ruminococcaceae bacterium]|nr:hypothetical protein [Oscillospiraceae bacterium]
MLTRPEFIKAIGSKYSEIRFYEKRGLLLPDFVNEKTKRHYYSDHAVKVYFYIQNLQKVGYSLDEIQSHLNGIDGLTDEEFYEKREKALTEQLDRLAKIKTEEPVRLQKAKKYYQTPVAKKEKDK